MASREERGESLLEQTVANSRGEDTAEAISCQIGVSRPSLEIEDLPAPEEVFNVKRVGVMELIFIVLGPGVIALGLAVGSGEWMLGPLAVGQYGFRGIGWVILLSVVLQTFYNVELARFTIATGEPPIVAFGRTPPGYLFWVPLTVFCFSLALMLGGWAVSAGSSLFALFMGRANLPQELEIVRVLGMFLLVTTFLFVLFGRNIERTLEICLAIFLTFILISLVLVTIAVVPLEYWGQALVSLVAPAAPPRGTDPSLLGALAGFAGLIAGLNFMCIGYYRDKGYGMGHKTGYIPGLIGGGKARILPVGKIFRENATNAQIWKRWFRYLLIDQWGVFFTGCMIGMVAPCVLVGYLSSLEGAAHPERASILVYAAFQLGERYGPVLFGWALLMGFFILYKTQIVILEVLTRNVTDAVYGTSPRFREWIGHDARRFYYPWMFVVVIIIGIMVHLALPVDLIVLSANLTNLASIIFPLIMIYLNRQLPKPARITWWSYLVLVANVMFFGFFFINFVVVQLTGSPLVRF